MRTETLMRISLSQLRDSALRSGELRASASLLRTIYTAVQPTIDMNVKRRAREASTSLPPFMSEVTAS